jgi:hypothetical protein
LSSQPLTIRLKDQKQAQPVDAMLHVGLTESQVRDAQAEWEPIRKTSIKRLLDEGFTMDELPKHWGWDWTRKISRLNNPLLTFYGIECNGRMQGMIEVAQEGYFSKLPSQAGKPLVYVKYVETAPWNIQILEPSPQYGGVGTQLIRAAVMLSRNENCKGRVGLHSLPGKNKGEPEWFYENTCNMEPIETERDGEGLLYFELTEKKSDKFI